MTKRHFEWAAEYVRSGTGPAGKRTYGENQAVRDAFYYLFHRWGPRFDGGRFLEACDQPPKPVRAGIIVPDDEGPAGSGQEDI